MSHAHEIIAQVEKEIHGAADSTPYSTTCGDMRALLQLATNLSNDNERLRAQIDPSITQRPLPALDHCEDCDPSFLNCWNCIAECRQRPRTKEVKGGCEKCTAELSAALAFIVELREAASSSLNADFTYVQECGEKVEAAIAKTAADFVGKTVIDAAELAELLGLKKAALEYARLYKIEPRTSSGFILNGDRVNAAMAELIRLSLRASAMAAMSQQPGTDAGEGRGDK